MPSLSDLPPIVYLYPVREDLKRMKRFNFHEESYKAYELCYAFAIIEDSQGNFARIKLNKLSATPAPIQITV